MKHVILLWADDGWQDTGPRLVGVYATDATPNEIIIASDSVRVAVSGYRERNWDRLDKCTDDPEATDRVLAEEKADADSLGPDFETVRKIDPDWHIAAGTGIPRYRIERTEVKP